MIPILSSDKKYAVMGLGKSGLATLAALQASQQNYLAWDDNAASRAAAQAQGYTLSDLNHIDWQQVRALILSPGIPHTFPSPNPIAKAAQDNGVPIIGDVELLFQAKPPARFLGITGTNGKSTTTALIAHILKTNGVENAVGGNLGTPVLDFPPLQKDNAYVIEMSSYQCELTPRAAFDIGVWLNITPDHIDRHGTLDGYIEAKIKMFRNAEKPQTAIIGVDDNHSKKFADSLEKAKHWNVIRISTAEKLGTGISACTGKLYQNGQEIFDFSETKTLLGVHNAQNIAAATATCLAFGLKPENIANAISTFAGLAHRQQLVRNLGAVSYINDSKATNADATAKALACFDNLLWIVGGRPKEGGLNGLESFMPRIKHAFLIGEAASDFAAWLEGKAAYTICGTLEKAVTAATTMAQKNQGGGVVLLSPACASFDQFANYEKRGDMFIEYVNGLPSTHINPKVA